MKIWHGIALGFFVACFSHAAGFDVFWATASYAFSIAINWQLDRKHD